MTTPGSPSSLPRQSSLQRALSELDIKRNGSNSEDDISPRSSTFGSKKVSKSSLQQEVKKIKACNFLEQYEQEAQLRGKTRL